jgi:hypothetical protein
MGIPSTVTVLHSGALYWERKPNTLILGAEKASTFAGMAPIKVVLQGSISPEIQRGIEAISTSVPVEIAEATNFKRSIESIKKADILCIIDVALTKNVHLPSKIADYVGACKPILYIGQPDSPTCRALKQVHPAFEQGLTVDEVALALKVLIGKLRLAGETYASSYDKFASRNVYRPLIEWIGSIEGSRHLPSPRDETGEPKHRSTPQGRKAELI